MVLMRIGWVNICKATGSIPGIQQGFSKCFLVVGIDILPKSLQIHKPVLNKNAVCKKPLSTLRAETVLNFSSRVPGVNS